MITQHGPQCDVCGEYILPIDEDERVNPFSVSGITEAHLICHNACKEKLQAAGRDWQKLPDGPLRRYCFMLRRPHGIR